MRPDLQQREFKSLLRAARTGDEGAWATIYQWLAPEILGFLRSGRLDDPEDVLGEVFLEIARKIGDFDGDRRGFRAWAFTIARSRRVDAIRRRARRREVRFDTGEHALLPAGLDVEMDALGAVILDDLTVYLDVLTDEQAEVLILRAIGEWSAPEVAEMIGKTVGAVEQLHHRAKKTLREILDQA